MAIRLPCALFRTRSIDTQAAGCSPFPGLAVHFCRRGLFSLLLSLEEIRRRVEQITGERFNSVLCNRYRRAVILSCLCTGRGRTRWAGTPTTSPSTARNRRSHR